MWNIAYQYVDGYGQFEGGTQGVVRIQTGAGVLKLRCKSMTATDATCVAVSSSSNAVIYVEDSIVSTCTAAASSINTVSVPTSSSGTLYLKCRRIELNSSDNGTTGSAIRKGSTGSIYVDAMEIIASAFGNGIVVEALTTSGTNIIKTQKIQADGVGVGNTCTAFTATNSGTTVFSVYLDWQYMSAFRCFELESYTTTNVRGGTMYTSNASGVGINYGSATTSTIIGYIENHDTVATPVDTLNATSGSTMTTSVVFSGAIQNINISNGVHQLRCGDCGSITVTGGVANIDCEDMTGNITSSGASTNTSIRMRDSNSAGVTYSLGGAQAILLARKLYVGATTFTISAVNAHIEFDEITNPGPAATMLTFNNTGAAGDHYMRGKNLNANSQIIQVVSTNTSVIHMDIDVVTAVTTFTLPSNATSGSGNYFRFDTLTCDTLALPTGFGGTMSFVVEDDCTVTTALTTSLTSAGSDAEFKFGKLTPAAITIGAGMSGRLAILVTDSCTVSGAITTSSIPASGRIFLEFGDLTCNSFAIGTGVTGTLNCLVRSTMSISTNFTSLVFGANGRLHFDVGNLIVTGNFTIGTGMGGIMSIYVRTLFSVVDLTIFPTLTEAAAIHVHCGMVTCTNFIIGDTGNNAGPAGPVVATVATTGLGNITFEIDGRITVTSIFQVQGWNLTGSTIPQNTQFPIMRVRATELVHNTGNQGLPDGVGGGATYPILFAIGCAAPANVLFGSYAGAGGGTSNPVEPIIVHRHGLIEIDIDRVTSNVQSTTALQGAFPVDAFAWVCCSGFNQGIPAPPSETVDFARVKIRGHHWRKQMVFITYELGETIVEIDDIRYLPHESEEWVTVGATWICTMMSGNGATGYGKLIFKNCMITNELGTYGTWPGAVGSSVFHFHPGSGAPIVVPAYQFTTTFWNTVLITKVAGAASNSVGVLGGGLFLGAYGLSDKALAAPTAPTGGVFVAAGAAAALGPVGAGMGWQ